MKNIILTIILISFITVLQAQQSTCSDDLLPRRNVKNGKMGFVDLFDNWKINPKYFEVFPFENSHAKVRFGNTYGMINCKGEEVIPPRFEALGFFSFGRIWAKDDKGWTIWDSSGNQLNEQHFEEYKKASIWNTATWVKSNSKWMMIDEVNGKIICDKSFTTIKILSDTLSLVSDDFYYGIINHKNCLFKIPETIVSAAKVSDKFLKLQYKDKRIDIIDLRGNTILKEPYYHVESAGNGLAKVKNAKKWGLIKTNGEIVLELNYDSIGYYKNGLLPVLKDKRWTYINSNLKPAFLSEYLEASVFFRAQAIVKNQIGWNIINTKGELLSDSIFQSIVYDDGQYFGLTKNGYLLIPSKTDSEHFDSIYFDDPNDFTRVLQMKQVNVYDFKNSKWKIKNNFDQIDIIGSNTLLVSKEGKMGLVDSMGNITIPLKYSSLSFEPGFVKPLFLAQLNDVQYLVDEKGKELISAVNLERQKSYFIENTGSGLKVYNYKGDKLIEEKYDAIKILDDKYLAYNKKEKWGIMKIDGEELTKPIYTEVNILSENQVSAKTKDNKSIILSNNSKPIKEELYFDEVVEKYGEGYIVLSNSLYQWLNDRLSSREKDFTSFQMLDKNIIALQKNNVWKIYSESGDLLSEKSFSQMKSENDKSLFRSGERWFYVNSKSRLVPFLPFD